MIVLKICTSVTLPTAPAILSAIHDATGAWIASLPATPERVFWALRDLQHSPE